MARRDEDHLSANDAAKLAAIELELAQCWAQVAREASSHEAMSSLQRHVQAKTEREFAAIVATRFAWWQPLCNPYGVWRFVAARRRFSKRGKPVVDDLVELSALLAFAQFGYRLERIGATKIRGFIRAGLISERDAWRLAHSLGCRVEDGDLAPSPISLSLALVGLFAGLGLLALSLIFTAHLAIALTVAESRDVCYAIGCGAVSLICASAGAIACTATWGRRDAARAIQALQDRDFNSPAVNIQPSFPSRLLW